MPTYISVINWLGNWPERAQPSIDDVRAAIEHRSGVLRQHGLHSVAFVPDEGECAAIMVASCANRAAVSQLVASILPGAQTRADTMLFDDDHETPVRVARRASPRPPRDYRRALLHAVIADR